MIVNDIFYNLGRPNMFLLVSMIVNDLLQSLGRSNMLLFGFCDRQWSLTKPRSPKYVFYLFSMIVNYLLKNLSCLNMCLIYTQWSSMISFITLVAQKVSYLALYDRQWSSKKHRSPKYVFFISMNVNDLLQSLCRPNMFFIWSLWSSMISCKASVAQICFLFDLYDRQWSPTKPRSPKNVYQYSLIWSSMIFYKASDVQICYYLVSVIANDLLQSLGRRNMFFICFLWSSIIF